MDFNESSNLLCCGGHGGRIAVFGVDSNLIETEEEQVQPTSNLSQLKLGCFRIITKF
jgi:hypothetical protein